MLTRRTALFSAAVATVTAATPAYAAPGDARRPRAHTTRRPQEGLVRFTLPAPTGGRPVGSVSLHLVDRARRDPWLPGRARRELMVDVRYPARTAQGLPRVPWLGAGAAAGFAALNNLTDVPADRVDWSAALTHAHAHAPVDRTAGGPRGTLPVVLYSPGVVDPRGYGSTTADDLASRGYVVVTVDHTYDATAVEFPGGRVETTRLPAEFEATGGDEERIRALLRKTLDVRVADLRFVLDALPSALPPELRRAADLSRVGAYGQSAGGFAALQTMSDDARVRAAADLDGVLAFVQEDAQPGHYARVAEDGLDRPFLLFGKDGNTPGTVPSWDALIRHSSAPHRVEELRGARHGSFTDAQVVVPQLVAPLALPAEAVEANIGTVDPARSVAAQRSALARLFGRALRH
ncbi:hydrolase [Streptomyces sp. SID5785]|uniref:alpha/beta hydrolase n=1 Tax=Streptomyces sp. SID5785 TaxID=2690309 RepID=UPI0013619CA8|nr:hydrolase [Streptomyces sp. SID5785]MZD09433.1 hydrolase [Streptomyces sp. SID5785]